MRQVPVHYLRSNETCWSPPAFIALDTETRIVQEDPEVHALRLWHARIADRRRQGAHQPGEHQAHGLTAAQCADQVDAWTAGRPVIWLYCHNLAFDLATTRLPVLLAARGWEVSDAAVDSGSPWVRMRKGRKHLTLVDSHSVLPARLVDVGAAVDLDKPELPGGDDEAAWLARCEADTGILAAALGQLLDWWDAGQFGRWSITGGATAWNTMRHMMPARQILIDPDQAARDDDRAAIYGGRRSVWRHGRLPRGRYSEIDFERAYTVAAAELALPRRRGYRFASLPVDHRLVDDPAHQWGIIAEVEIETSVARWPARADGRVWYPVGRFRTTLAGPDIAEARRLGCLRAIGPGWVHQLGYALAPWGRWCLAAQADPVTPPVARMFLKHAGRAAIGKWAQRSWTRKRIGVSTTGGWGYEDAWVNESNTRGCIIDMAGVKFLSVPDHDGDNSYPAVLAWVESYVRVALARAIESVGEDAVIQCDTDGMIIDIDTVAAGWRESRDDNGHGPRGVDYVTAALDQASEVCAPLRLREKTVYQRLEITGPQHLVMDGHRRWSGVPPSAELAPDGRLVAWTWPHLAYQMGRGDPRGFVRVAQSYVIGGSYAPAWCLAGGATVPVEAAIGAGGVTVLVPWAQTRHARHGARLGPHQNSALARYMEVQNEGD